MPIFRNRSFIAAVITALGALSTTTSANAADKTLTIYTYESFTSEWGPGPKVKAAFEKTCNCTVNFVSVADGVALLSRLKLEGAGTRADVVLGLDTNLIAEAKETGLFDASGIDTSGLN
jgi:thiamine transport system substrate-binding protein